MSANASMSRRLAVSAGALLAATVASGAQAQPGPSGAREDSPDAVVDAFLDAYRALDVERMVSLMAEGISFEDPTFHLRANGRDEMRRLCETQRRSIAAVRITPFNRISAHPWVMSQQRIAGTLVRPDGARTHFDVQGVSMFEIVGGRIRRWFDYYDVLTFREQTGHA